MESLTPGAPGRGGAARRPFFRRRKSCPFSGPNAPKIDYKDVKLLQRFVSERGKKRCRRQAAHGQEYGGSACTGNSTAAHPKPQTGGK